MKQNYRKKSLKLLLALSLGLCVAHTGYAMPSNGTVVSGDANISNLGNITLSGTNIINWQQFGIGANETVTFNGSGSPFAVLNRVTGSDVSNILGTLNGQGGAVFLVNPNGIVFGNGASINAASFVASTLSISDNAFTNLINGGNGNFTSNGSTGKISFTGNANFNNSNSTFMGNSIEIDAGVSLTLGAPTAFLTGPNINLTNTSNNGNLDITSYQISNATADNTIKSTGTIDSKNSLALLGGKVDLAGNVTSAKDLFIAAGNNYSLEKTDGDFWFDYNKMNTIAGNTVNIAEGATVTSAGESAILANSVTNNGAITVNSQHGMAMYVLDNLISTFDANGKPISGNVSTSKNNKFTNNGTVAITNGGRFDIMANALDNKGAITTTHGDVVLTGNLSGNAINKTKLQVANDQYTGILILPDAKGSPNPTYSFINPVQIPEVEKGSALEAAIHQALDILNKLGATPEEKAKATKDIIQGHVIAGVESSKESTTTTPVSKANEGSSNTNNLVVSDNSTSSNLTVENEEVN